LLKQRTTVKTLKLAPWREDDRAREGLFGCPDGLLGDRGSERGLSAAERMDWSPETPGFR